MTVRNVEAEALTSQYRVGEVGVCGLRIADRELGIRPITQNVGDQSGLSVGGIVGLDPA